MLRKVANILKNTILCIAAVSMIVLACLFFIPHKTTPINQTLDMVIYPGSSNTEGTVPITLNGLWEQFLLRDDRLILTIDDFEHYYNIRPSNPILGETTIGETTYIELTDSSTGYQTCFFVASSTITGEDSVTLIVQFKDDLSGWRIRSMPNFGVISPETEIDPSYRYHYAFNWLPWEEFFDDSHFTTP